MILADVNISGDWLLAALKVVIVSLGSGGAAWIMAIRRSAKQKVEVTAQPALELKEPVPEVPVKRVYTPPTFSQHQDVVRRVSQLETDVRDIRKEQAVQFNRLLEVGEERKDKLIEKMDTMARGFHSRVDQIMDERKPKKGQ